MTLFRVICFTTKWLTRSPTLTTLPLTMAVGGWVKMIPCTLGNRSGSNPVNMVESPAGTGLVAVGAGDTAAGGAGAGGTDGAGEGEGLAGAAVATMGGAAGFEDLCPKASQISRTAKTRSNAPVAG